MEKELLIALIEESETLRDLVSNFVVNHLSQGSKKKRVLEIIQETRKIYIQDNNKIAAIKFLRGAPTDLVELLRKQFPALPAHFDNRTDSLGLAEAKWMVEALW